MILRRVTLPNGYQATIPDGYVVLPTSALKALHVQHPYEAQSEKPNTEFLAFIARMLMGKVAEGMFSKFLKFITSRKVNETTEMAELDVMVVDPEYAARHFGRRENHNRAPLSEAAPVNKVAV